MQILSIFHEEKQLNAVKSPKCKLHSAALRSKRWPGVFLYAEFKLLGKKGTFALKKTIITLMTERSMGFSSKAVATIFTHHDNYIFRSTSLNLEEMLHHYD